MLATATATQGLMRLALACLLALLASPSRAEESIIVTGRGLAPPPGSVAYGSERIGSQRLSLLASGRLEDALADVAGVQSFRRSDSRSSNPTAQGITLRALGGNASSRALLLLDGVPQADPFFGSIAFTSLSPDRLGSIRVTRGGGAGAFGAGALAGTIEIESAGHESIGSVSASALYGSRDTISLSASANPKLGNGFVSVNARWDKGDGFYTAPEAQRSPADVPAAFESGSASLRAVAPLGDAGEVQARFALFRDGRSLRFAGADNSSAGEDASIRFISRGDWQVDALAYVQRRDFTNVVISSTTFRRTLDQRATPSLGLGSRLELRPPLPDSLRIRLGLDARYAQGRADEDGYNASSGALTLRRSAGGNSRILGLYGEGDWTSGKFVLTGSVRVDQWHFGEGFLRERNAAGTSITDRRFAPRSDWSVNGRGGVVLKLDPALSLRAAGYTGFRLPTLNELYRPFTVFPVTTRANEALEPERLWGAEVGFEARPVEALRISATAFVNRLNDAIANVSIGTNVRQRRNVDAVSVRGIEVSLAAQWRAFSLSASYAYADPRVRAAGQMLDGKRPAQSPQHQASATLGWIPLEGVAANLTLRATSRQFEDDLETDVLPGYVRADAALRLPIPMLRHAGLLLRAENIFDRRFLTRNSGGSVDLGSPRSLWIGLDWQMR